jgi:hypothetical protein
MLPDLIIELDLYTYSQLILVNRQLKSIMYRHRKQLLLTQVAVLRRDYQGNYFDELTSSGGDAFKNPFVDRMQCIWNTLSPASSSDWNITYRYHSLAAMLFKYKDWVAERMHHIVRLHSSPTATFPYTAPRELPVTMTTLSSLPTFLTSTRALTPMIHTTS